MSALASWAPCEARRDMLGCAVLRERARTVYLEEREGVDRTCEATEKPWLPVAPKTARMGLDMLVIVLRCGFGVETGV